MEIGTDYIFRDDLFDAKDQQSTCPVELKLDPFAGVVYRYTTVTFKVGEDDVPRLLYDYDIIKTNDLSMMTLRKNEKFNSVVGLVLNSMLVDLGDIEENEIGTDNPQESDTEGRLHKKSSSVS